METYRIESCLGGLSLFIWKEVKTQCLKAPRMRVTRLKLCTTWNLTDFPKRKHNREFTDTLNVESIHVSGPQHNRVKFVCLRTCFPIGEGASMVRQTSDARRTKISIDALLYFSKWELYQWLFLHWERRLARLATILNSKTILSRVVQVTVFRIASIVHEVTAFGSLNYFKIMIL